MLVAGFKPRLELELPRSPVGVVVLDELTDGHAYFLEIREDPTVDGLLLERSIESLSDTVGLGLLDEPETVSPTSGESGPCGRGAPAH